MKLVWQPGARKTGQTSCVHANGH